MPLSHMSVTVTNLNPTGGRDPLSSESFSEHELTGSLAGSNFRDTYIDQMTCNIVKTLGGDKTQMLPPV